eukprot:Hpha_TRINITY_DN13740_c0_g1::TRINITY_DN13740_c0_g1_i1::g.142471::m.142471
MRAMRGIGIRCIARGLALGPRPYPFQRRWQSEASKPRSEGSNAPPPPPGDGSERRHTRETMRDLGLRERMKLLGPPAIGIYLIIHTIGFCVMWAAVSFGFPVRGYLEQVLPPEYLQKLPKGPWLDWSLALLANKCFVPLQAMLALWVTPRVAPYLFSTWAGSAFLNLVARWTGGKKVSDATAAAAAASAAPKP